MEFKIKDKSEKYAYEDLVALVERLRAPGGCPWDREQTHESIKKNLVEEAYELVEAIDGGDPEKIADESGDMLLQVVFHAVIAKDNGEYDIDDVSDAICRKLVHRHPHVFGDVEADSAGEVLKNWDAIKRADRDQDTVAAELRGVSKFLPALMRCEKIQKKAAKSGYDFGDAEITLDTSTANEEDCGRLLFEAVRLCREGGVDPELALAAYTEKFIDEFEAFESGK